MMAPFFCFSMEGRNKWIILVVVSQFNRSRLFSRSASTSCRNRAYGYDTPTLLTRMPTWISLVACEIFASPPSRSASMKSTTTDRTCQAMPSQFHATPHLVRSVNPVSEIGGKHSSVWPVIPPCQMLSDAFRRMQHQLSVTIALLLQVASVIHGHRRRNAYIARRNDNRKPT